MSTELSATATGETTERPSELDEFDALLKQSFKPRSERAATEVENAVGTLVRHALADASVIKDDVLETIEEMIAQLDRQLSAQLNEILHAEEFRAIEGAWRGLAYLSERSETDATLKLKVMNVTKSDLAAEFKRNRNSKWDQSGVFKSIYEAEFDQLGGEPYGCIVGDFHFGHSVTDVQLLKDIGKVAAAAHCPFIAGAEPGLLNLDSWNDLAKPRDLSKIYEAPDYAGWNSLRESVNSRYIGLCMPRVLAREPYGAKSVPVDEFDFEEATDGHSGEKYTWMNAAYAMAANINRAHKDYGWTVRIRGVQSGGEVIDLPTHAFLTDDASIDLKCPTEVSISDRREAELSKCGLMPLVHRKNTDKAAFIGAQSLYRPSKRDNEDATASENISARLPYIFAVSRFSHFLKCMVRDKIGENIEREALETWLHNWIFRYVDADPENSSPLQKAKRPLRDAKVEIFADPENPGRYSARFFLRPHFQLEEMDIGMSLVSRLPQTSR